MANVKISQLGDATTPLAGTETLEIVQGGVNKKVATSELLGSTSFTIGIAYPSDQKPGDAVVVSIPRMKASYTIPTDLADSACDAVVGPTAEAVIILKKNGSQFATMTIAIGATSAVTLSGTETIITASDLLTVTYPTQDATWAGVTVSINAIRS